jgi:hypothetical protein
VKLNICSHLLSSSFLVADMKVLGGIEPVVERLEAEDPAQRAMAAYVLGTAASNNVVFQQHLLEAAPTIFTKLRNLMLAPEAEVANKALYAVGALVRNSRPSCRAFAVDAGKECLTPLCLCTLSMPCAACQCLVVSVPVRRGPGGNRGCTDEQAC